MRMSHLAAAALATTVALTAAAEAAPVYATQIDVSRTGAAAVGWDATTVADNSNRLDPRNALGAPNSGPGDDPTGFYSMGFGGIAVLGFGTDFYQQGTVFEVTFGCGGPQLPNGNCSYQESANVYAFSGPYTPFNSTFTWTDLINQVGAAALKLVASIPNGPANTPGGFTFAISEPFSYLVLRDTSPFRSDGDGFDIDAVSVSPVPVPAAGLLLIGALGGLAALRRRRAASRV